MAVMHDRYGDAPDIESKPEWEEMSVLQRGWTGLLAEHAKVSEEAAFEAVYDSLRSKFAEGNRPRTLSKEEAVEIVRGAFRILALGRRSPTSWLYAKTTN